MSKKSIFLLYVAWVACTSCNSTKEGGTDSTDFGTEGPGVDTSLNDPGTVTVNESSSNIAQLTQSHEMPLPIAPTQRWTVRTNGLCGGHSCRNGPRHMYSAAFNDTLLVSWMAVSEVDPTKQYGNVATFRVDDQGHFTLLRNVSFEKSCQATYGISTNSDGSIIAVLCQAKLEAGLFPGAINLLDTRRTPNCTEDWEGRCYPIGHFSGIDSPLYIFEYTGGAVTGKPDRMVLINHSIGGWKMGHHELMLNQAQDTYFVHLKVTAGPSEDNRHEGLVHFAVRRTGNFEYVAVTDGWSCGGGHVLANRMAYNSHHDTWSMLCTLDLCRYPNQYENGRCDGISWYTVPGVTKTPAVTFTGDNLLDLEHISDWEHSGGSGTLLSLGVDGWLALAAGPGYAAATPKPSTIGLLHLPLSVPELEPSRIATKVPVYENGSLTGQQDAIRYQWDWLYLPEPDESLGLEKRAGMANMAYFDTKGEDSERLLIGWSPTMEFQGIAKEYVVSEMDRNGKLRGEALRLPKSGWGEDNLWTTMPNSGCVVFPFAWVGDSPGSDYPIEGDDATKFPTTIYMTSLCPRGDQPPLADTPLPQTDEERWPTP
ncbi:MAG: hypothetical protein MUC50_21765 [Myxococcota bacterium]|jgi:hypothetical protein|nr:hypothetical protein [Myxococcota bacterium]